ncbi:MAG: pitrilysin family protein [Patescibacteria group bacterium]|nr:pitrilysin family protein [Patescibacteria group bacterium]
MQHTHLHKLHKRIEASEPIAGVRLFVVPTGLRGITRIAGSLLGGDWYSQSDNSALAGIVAEMLDEGTRRHSKHALSERLENVGAALAFSSGSHYVRFDGAMRPKDSGLFIETLAEELRESAFRTSALRSVVKRALGNLDAEAEDTGSQAGICLSRLLFPEGHPNRAHTTDESRRDVERTSAADVRKFHARGYGTGSLTIVAAGEIDQAALEKSIRTHFRGWKRSPLALREPERAAEAQGGCSEAVYIRDKASVSLVVGAPIRVTATHEDFYPLLAGFGILGGLPFISRLFQSVRERLGLTYHISASVEGALYRSDGYWVVRASFAPELLKQGREAIEREIERFALRGVNARELTEYKQAVLGGHLVGLASAGRLAAAVRGTLEQERPLSFLDEYLAIIQGLTLDDVNRAIQHYVRPDEACWVAAGSVEEYAKRL